MVGYQACLVAASVRENRERRHCFLENFGLNLSYVLFHVGVFVVISPACCMSFGHLKHLREVRCLDIAGEGTGTAREETGELAHESVS